MMRDLLDDELKLFDLQDMMPECPATYTQIYPPPGLTPDELAAWQAEWLGDANDA